MKIPKKGTPKIKYYSFWIGHPHSKRTEWILQDLKIPATCIREAILLHSFSKTFMHFEANNTYARKNMTYTPPNQLYVFMFYRSVIEYERLFTPGRGYTVHQYKKIGIHTVYTYLNDFALH